MERHNLEMERHGQKMEDMFRNQRALRRMCLQLKIRGK